MGDCIKCRERAELKAEVGDAFHGETWSGRIEPSGEKVWYNVSRAKEILAACPVPANFLADVSVRQLWEMQVSKSHVEAAHLEHVDMSDPVLLATTAVDGPNDYITLIDGNHRVARAFRDGIETLKAVKFSKAFSQTLLIDPREAVLNELLVEILATGGRVDSVDGVFVVTGGNPAPQTLDDHPLRLGFLSAIRSGPAVFNLPRL